MVSSRSVTPEATSQEWTKRAGPVAFQIALATFGILALELALIRWTSGQIRAFAYFNNLVLVGAFLGMGLGVALGRRRPGPPADSAVHLVALRFLAPLPAAPARWLVPAPPGTPG